MKVVLLVMLLVLVSCASRAPMTYKQSCGAKGMVLAGVRSDSGSTSSYNMNYGAVNGSYDGESISCVVPQNAKQECEALVYQKAARPVLEYNSSYQSKKFLSGLGYYAFIVPGIGLKLYYDGQVDQAVAEAQKIEDTHLIDCVNVERDTASN